MADSVYHILVARRKTLFDDRPVEIAELTYVIKQDLSSLNSQISSLQALSKSQHAQASRNSNLDQEGEHNKNVSAVSRRTSLRANDQLGSGAPPRKACRRFCELQRSPGSSHEEHSSISISNRELRLFCVGTVPILSGSTAICVALVQHTYEVTDAITWLSELQFRHP